MIRLTCARFHQDQEGQHLVMLALLMPLLVACLALTVDVGNVYAHHRMAQNAADSAALAGITVLVSKGQSAAQDVAAYYARENGYNNDRSTNAVQLTFSSNCLHVTITDYVSPILAQVVWRGVFTVGAGAKACSSTGSGSASVIVLDPTASKALELSGGSTLTVPKGTVHVNSNALQAVNVSGGGKIVTSTPTTIVGGYAGTAISPSPILGAPVQPDPLAELAAPSTSSCGFQSEVKISNPATIGPGCYMGGLTISSTSVTFLPGIYLIGGKGLVFSGSSVGTGSGVMFYVSAGKVDISGGTVLNISPPTSGLYEGMLLFHGRSNSQPLKVSGGSAIGGMQGIVYAANAHMELSGGTTTQTNFAVRTLLLSGSATLTVNGYNSSNWGMTTYTLVE